MKRLQAFQGQFTLPLVYQGVSKYAWQTVGQSTFFWRFPLRHYLP